MYKYSEKAIGGIFKNTPNVIAENHADGTQRIILAAYRDFESRINLVDDRLTAIEQVRVAIKEKIGKFTKSEIMKLVPGIGKASVENSLKKLVEDGVIEKHGKGKATFYTRND